VTKSQNAEKNKKLTEQNNDGTNNGRRVERERQ
jgi:hypothetical protein